MLNLFELDRIYVYFFTAFTAFGVCYVTIPTLVKMARYKNLYDNINDRKVHKDLVPRLGGIGFFAGLFLSLVLFVNPADFKYLGVFAASLFILFFIGLKDDILIISPLTKLIGQILAVSILILFGNGGLTDFQGVFGIHQVPWYVGYLVSVVIYIATINAFNFVDGIDGLAASLGIISISAYGIWFFIAGKTVYFLIAISAVFSLLAFLRYNLFSKNNKIFLGDTGSMLIGFVVTYLAIRFNQTILTMNADMPGFIYPAPAMSFGFVVIPYFDLVRVIAIRLINKRHIYSPDNSHLHHIFLSLGFTHKQITLFFSLVSIVLIAIFWIIAHYTSTLRLLLIEFIIVLFLSFVPEFFYQRVKNQ